MLKNPKSETPNAALPVTVVGPRMVSLIALLVVVVVIGMLFVRVMATFVLPMFVALLLATVFNPVHQWTMQRLPRRERLAAAVTTGVILVIVLVPLAVVSVQAGAEATRIAGDWSAGGAARFVQRARTALGIPPLPTEVATRMQAIEVGLQTAGQAALAPERLQQLSRELREALAATPLASKPGDPPPTWEPAWADWQNALAEPVGAAPLSLPDLARIRALWGKLATAIYGGPLDRFVHQQTQPERLEASRQQLQVWLGAVAVDGTQAVGGFLLEFVIGIVVMVVGLYYFLADGPVMIASLMRLSPLNDVYKQQLLTEFSTVARAVVLATLLSALGQGLLAGIGYLVAGFSSVALLTLLTMLLALVPFVGAAAVWGTCSLWLWLHDGRSTAAILLAIYGVAVVSLADNIIKPMVLKGRSNMHPLLALLSVLGGVKALGPVGIFVGPMVVAFLQAVLNMLHTELQFLQTPSTQADNPQAGNLQAALPPTIPPQPGKIPPGKTQPPTSPHPRP